jgi:WD40 repeat protein
MKQATKALCLGVVASVSFFFAGPVAQADDIYVAVHGSNTIMKFDSSGNASVFADASSGLNMPEGLAFDSSGNLYVANANTLVGGTGDNTILKFDSSGQGSLFAISGTNNYSDGLAFDSSGNLYVANWNDGTIGKFDSSGNGSVFASGLINPSFIAIQVPEPTTWSLLALGAVALLGGLRLRRRTS